MKAKDAFAISAENDKTHYLKILQDLYFRINQAALRGEYRIYDRQILAAYNPYGQKEADLPKYIQKIFGTLRQDGYRVEIRVEENQFVDWYMEISWEKVIPC